MSISHISVHLHTLRVVACRCTEPTRVTVRHHLDRLGVLAQRCDSLASRVGSGSGSICAPLEDCNMCVARECDERLPVGRFVDEALRLVQRFQSTESGAMRCRAVKTKNEHDRLCPANWKEDNPRRPSHETPFLCCGRGSNVKITRRIIPGTHASTSKTSYVHEGRDVWVQDTYSI